MKTISKTKTYRPSGKLRTKYLLQALTMPICVGLFMFSPFLVLFFILRNKTFGEEFIQIFTYAGIAVGGIVLLVICIGTFLASARVRSLEYKITSTSVTVSSGVINKVLKTVPFKKITNVEIRRGMYDRLTGLATIRIHTAGYSGTTTAEGIIEGIEEYEKVYEQILKKID